MKWIKNITQGSGWAAMLAGLVTVALKQFGVEIEEAAILPLIVAALGLIHGGSFIPVADKTLPVMSDLHNRTIDALFHLDKTLVGNEAVKNAVGVLWNAAREIKKREVKNVPAD